MAFDNLLYTLAAPAVGLYIAHLVAQRVARRRTNVYLLPSPPSEESSWLYGHELRVWEDDASEAHTRWTESIGQMYRIKAAFGHDDILVVADHAAARYVFANVDTFIKPPYFQDHIANLLGRGIVWAEHDEHRLQRRVVAPAFSPECIRGMADFITSASDRLVHSLTDIVRAAEKESAVVNISEWTTTVTLDFIARASFGQDWYPEGYHKPAAEAMEILASWKEVSKMADTFPAFCALPLIRRFPWIARLPVEELRKEGVAKVVVTRIARELVRRGGEPGGRDVLSLILRGAQESRSKTGETLSEQQVIDNIVTFIMVGHETSGGVIKFTLLDLAKKPEVQARLREEILAKGGALGHDDVEASRLPYLDAVVREGLRLHPAAPRTDRYVTRDDVIPLRRPVTGPDGKQIHEVLVKKGQVINLSFKTMNVDRTVWGPDAHEFNAERWLTPGGVPSASELPSGWGGMATFCDGPRNCLGYRLAILEMKIIIAHLVRAFTFADTGAEVHQRISPTIEGKVDGVVGVTPVRLGLVRN